MTKNINIKSGTVFGSLTAAKEHYSNLRESTEAGSMFSDPERSDIVDIYQRYCHATNWIPEEVSEVMVDWDNRERQGNQFAQTKAFHVINKFGKKNVFSIDKALSAIAK